ncbi:hypothetical protein SAY86_012283 [Trapa natans]|uniref:Uncharacterized protein n=1 Tax=Trapa natans TaxID=22666 RepID=A0AAN7LXQ7_TRANT|nr:hypothetical protein SAY86_012283 [Trapa natans]
MILRNSRRRRSAGVRVRCRWEPSGEAPRPIGAFMEETDGDRLPAREGHRVPARELLASDRPWRHKALQRPPRRVPQLQALRLGICKNGILFTGTVPAFIPHISFSTFSDQ